MRFKVAVVSKAFITGFPPKPENSKLMDIEVDIVILEANTQMEAEDAAVGAVADEIYARRGGGPLWVPQAVACMEWNKED